MLGSLKDYAPFPDWVTEESKSVLTSGRYLDEGENLRDRYYDIARNVANRLFRCTPTRSYQLKDAVFFALYNGYIGLASAILTNFGKESGLPVSCNLMSLPDSINGITRGLSELSALSKHGAGVSVDINDIRPSGSSISGGGTSSGLAYPAKLVDTIGSYVNQNGKRPGAVSVNVEFEHPDCYQLLLNMDHTEGAHRTQLDCNVGVSIKDSTIKKLLEGDPTVNKIWGKMLQTQMETGSPYVFFTDTVNRNRPVDYKTLGLYLRASNICQEILRYYDEGYTGVCVVSSINVSKWDEIQYWEHEGYTVPQVLVYILEAVVDEYIDKARDLPYLQKAFRSVLKERALGIGVLGLHTLYQQKELPFKHSLSRELNNDIFKWIEEEANSASIELACRGYPEWSTQRRHLALTAVAPTRSNSFILGVSEGINPIESNYYVAKQAQGDFPRKNPTLEKLLEKKGRNTPAVWSSILDRLGSIMHLDFLSFAEKMVFLNARELDQFELLDQAADRQKFIDQSQSLNRWVNPMTPPLLLTKQILHAWRKGVQTLYYTRSANTNVLRPVLPYAFIVTKQGCEYCEKAKQLLTSKRKAITEFKSEEIDLEYFDFPSFPQIWMNGYFIGGYEELTMYLDNGSMVEQTKQLGDCDACGA